MKNTDVLIIVDCLQDKNIPSGFTLNFTSSPEAVELGGGGDG